jgi:HAD superfamily hydrolase (TIGR01509 family)
MAIRALLFDFDGLLVDTEGPSYRTWAEVYERHGHELSIDTWSAAIGTLDGFDPVAHLAELGVELDADAVEARRQRDLDLTDAEELRPGVAAYLDAAHARGLRAAIVSSSSDWWIERHLGRLGLVERFDAIVCANGDAARAKPRPTLYLDALERLRVRAEEAVAFEDSPNGIRAAKAAGLVCVAVPNPVTASLDLAQADLVVEAFTDVPLTDLLVRFGPVGSQRPDRSEADGA